MSDTEENNLSLPETIVDSEGFENTEVVEQTLNDSVCDENVLSQTLQAMGVDENVEVEAPVFLDDSDKIKYRQLKFEDLEHYKQLLKQFPHGFIGILFKEICENEKGEFYAFGAFKENGQLIGMIVGIRDYAQIRQFTDLEAGLAAMTGKKLSHIVTIIVDPKFRRNNIGTKLLNGFMEFVGDYTAKFLLIPHKNIAAQQFFESQQFGALSTLRKFYNEFEDALLFVDKDSNRD
uniref:N-acetyltransferase domain-containing protein n=2 Tax=Panagrolaimus sp. PS1159 TaxID=55785 RepID=A0AC35FEP8_9BILA